MTKDKEISHSLLPYFSILIFLFCTALALLFVKKAYALQEQVAPVNIKTERLEEKNEEFNENKISGTQQLLLEKIYSLNEKQLEDLTSYLDALTKESHESELPDFVPEASENQDENDGFPLENSPMPESETAAFVSELSSCFPLDNGSWSLYVSDLATGDTAAVDSHSMQAASLIKLYIMGAVYENYEALSRIYSSQSLDNLLNPMITVSDNDAANTLVEYLGNGDSRIGMAIVNYFCQTHGFNDTVMGRLLLQSKENGDNYTSVTDTGKFLNAVYEGAKHPEEQGLLAHADAMYELLKQQTRKHKIPANLPDCVKTANKTGELADVENDAAILYHSEEGNDLVVCFMSEYVTAPGNAQSKIAELSRSIYDHYNP